MITKRFMSILSLAQKAGVIKTGDFAVSYCIQEKTAKLVILAKNAGPNTMKKFANKSDYYGVEIVTYQTREVLSWAIGKDNVVVLAIVDENFAKKLMEIISEDD